MNARIAFLIGAAALLMGCPSISTMGLARTLPQGKSQMYVNPGLMALKSSGYSYRIDPDGTTETIPSDPTWSGTTILELGYRYGVTDTVEVGGKLSGPGGGIDAKISLLRPDSDLQGLNVSINPAVLLQTPGGDGFGIEFNKGLLIASIPVLFGQRYGGHELTLAPKLVSMTEFGDRRPRSAFYAGGSIGFAPRVHQRLRVVPELAALFYMGGDSIGVNNIPFSTFFGNSPFVQFSVGFLFDSE